ncbi:toxin-antitoxin system YwqK family antitoxin [Emticicia fontis]
MDDKIVKKEYYESGQLRLESHHNKDDKPHGIWLLYHENGQLSDEIHFNNGDKHGTWRQWDSKGRLHSERNFNENWLHGVSSTWDKKGKKTNRYYWFSDPVIFDSKHIELMAAYLENAGYKVEPPFPKEKTEITPK